MQAEEQAQALDPNGRRYLLAFSGHIEDSSDTTSEEATWALHSQSKIVCLQTVISQCPNELILWSDVRRHKLSYWVEDEQIVRPSRTLDLRIASLTVQILSSSDRAGGNSRQKSLRHRKPKSDQYVNLLLRSTKTKDCLGPVATGRWTPRASSDGEIPAKQF